MEKDGVLTEAVCSGTFRKCFAGPGLQLYQHHMPLQNRNLTDVSLLCKYVNLHKLELQNNKIKDLSCVGHMPNLAVLDASHNEIADFFGFQPPRNLKEVDFSHNCLTKMKDLSSFSSLSKVNLDNNSFSEICGFEECRHLVHLSLANNKISRISSLHNAPLKHLNLRGNRLTTIEGLESQKILQVLDLSLNQISSLSGLQDLHVLCQFNMEGNKVIDFQECKHLCNLLLLRDLNLLGNPVQEQPDYRLFVVSVLQHLTLLDQEKVTPEEKVCALYKFDPPLEVVAARDHMTHLVYQMMQPQVLLESTLPSVDSPYPMLVLTGPQCCGKRELAHRLCQELSEYFNYGVCHTTRAAYFGEEDGVDYHFVTEEEFLNMIQMGKFIQTVAYGGHRYGLTRASVEEVAREGLACCVHMELEGVLSLKNSHFEPRYVLLIPTQVDRYVSHLKQRDLYSTEQIERAVSRIELYANFNREHPGSFDNVIPSDDWEEAYKALRRVVNGYLVMEEPDEDKSALHTDVNPEEQRSPRRRPWSDSASRLSLDPSHLSNRFYHSLTRDQLGPQKSQAELVSVKRREQLVRDAIMGRSPAVDSHPLNSSTETGPSSLLNHDPSAHLSRASSVAKSPSDSCASSVLSLPGSARALSPSEPLHSSAQGPDREASKALSTSHKGPRPRAQRRPNSSMKTILPPIPPGRRTPLAPSPVPSTSQSPAAQDTQAQEDTIHFD